MDKYGYTQREIEKQGHWTEKRDGEMLYSDKVAIDSIVDNYDPLPDAKVDAILRINEQSQSLMQNIEDSYPEFEKRTWPTQKAEVEAWDKNNNSPTPLLDIIASTRGVERVALLNKAKSKVEEYNLYAATLAGKRQKLEDEIVASIDLDFICTVKFGA